jgi:hypothetical protein
MVNGLSYFLKRFSYLTHQLSIIYSTSKDGSKATISFLFSLYIINAYKS